MKKIFVLIALFLIFAGLNTASGQPAGHDADSKHGIIYVYQNPGKHDFISPPVVLIDNKPVGKINSYTYYEVYVAPGKHEIMLEKSANKLQYDIAGNDTYFISVGNDWNGFEELEDAGTVKGQEEINNYPSDYKKQVFLNSGQPETPLVPGVNAKNSESLKAPENSGTGTLYIYRNTGLVGMLAAPEVFLNGNLIGVLKNASYYVLHVKPGQYTLTMPYSGNQNKNEITIQENEEYYYSAVNEFLTGLVIKYVNPEKGKSEIISCSPLESETSGNFEENKNAILHEPSVYFRVGGGVFLDIPGLLLSGHGVGLYPVADLLLGNKNDTRFGLSCSYIPYADFTTGISGKNYSFNEQFLPVSVFVSLNNFAECGIGISYVNAQSNLANVSSGYSGVFTLGFATDESTPQYLTFAERNYLFYDGHSFLFLMSVFAAFGLNL